MDGGKTCPVCGQANNSGVKFCEGCGYQFPVEAAPAADAQPAASGMPEQNAQAGAAFGQTAQNGSFGAAPQESGFGQAAQSGSFGSAPQGSGFGQAAQNGGFGTASQQGGSFGQTAQSGSFGAAPQGSGFGQAAQSGSFGSAPQGSGFGQTAQSGSFGSAPQGSGFGQTAQSGSFGQAPQNSGFGSAPQGGGFGSTPQQTAAPKKKGNGGLIAAIIGIIVVLLGAGVAVAGFALGWFGGKKTIELSEKKLSIEVGEEATVEIKNYEDDLTKVTLEYSTEDKKIAEIASEYDDAFVVKGVSEGKTTVTVSGKNCEPVSITVKVSEAAKAEPTEAPKATEAPAATEKPEPTAQPTQAASSNYTTIKEAYGDDEFKIYLPDGFSFDYEEEDSAVMSDRSGNTIYVYSEMPGAPYYYLHPEEMEDDAEYDFSEFQFESVKIGTAPNGNDLYAAYRYDPNDEYGDYEVYYIYFAYEDWYGTEDYIVVEFSADYAEDDEAWFVEMAETIFGQ